MPYKTIKEVMNEKIGSIRMDPFQNDLEWATIEEIRKETIWPNEWNSVIGLVPYIKRMRGDLVGLEVGTGKGESAYLLLEECPNIKKLYTIDPYLEYSNWKELVSQDEQNKAKEVAEKNLSIFGNRVEMLDGDKLKWHEESSVDFIFLDGADSYDDVMTDFNFYYPLLKSKGLMAGHNYQLPEVRRAMMDWREKNKVRVPIQRITNFSYFWMKT